MRYNTSGKASFAPAKNKEKVTAMTLNQLRYFQVLARMEHFHHAAASLYISQPALSRAISQLEQELGVSLFEKRGRNVALTPEGRLFLAYTDRALEQLDQGIAQISSFASMSDGVSIGCVLPAVSTYLAPLLERYRQKLGRPFRCRTWTGASQELLEGMLNGRYDLIYCSYIPHTKGVHFTPVCAFPYCVVTRKDDPLASRPFVLPEDLNGRAMLFTEPKPYADIIRGVLAALHVTPRVAGLSNDETVLLGMVEAGLGVFISTDYPQIHSDQIAILPLRQDRLLRYVYLATCEGRSYSPHAQSLIAYSLQQAPSLIPEHHLP